jgi:phenylalanyl-tRNA synthetase beta chain
MDFYDLKGVLEELTEGLHVKNVSFAATNHPMLHPGRAAALRVGDKEVGVFGQLHPVVAERWELPAQPVLVGEFKLDDILAATDSRFIVKPISRYPAVVQDIALIVEESIEAGRVEALIRQTGGTLLSDARLFDIYRGEPLPSGKKSLAYTLTFQAPDHVLSDTDAAKLRDKVVNRLKREVRAELRTG